MSEKLCVECNIIKPMTEYYKAGKYWQKHCKFCHNSNRKNFKRTSTYIAKKKGFFALSEEIQQDIKKGLYEKVYMSILAKKYGIKYNNLLNWRKKGIPEYQPESNSTII